MTIVKLSEQEIHSNWSHISAILRLVLPLVVVSNVYHYSKYFNFIKRYDGIIIGFFEAFGDSISDVELLNIASAYKGCGSFVIDHLKHNYDHISLTPVDDSKTFYEKMGFKLNNDLDYEWHKKDT